MKRIFINANVVDVINKTVIWDQCVLTDDGIIIAIGNDIDPSGAEITDLGGCFMTPGLFNCHVHLWSNCSPIQTDVQKETEFDASMWAIKNAEALLRSGVTFARDVGTRNRTAEELKKNVKNGNIKMSPDLVTCGSALCMTGGATWNVGALQCDGVDECVKGTRLQIREGADYVKLYSSGSVLTAGMDPESPQLTEDELRAAVKTAHDAGKKTCCHAQNTASIANSVRAGVDHIEHGIGMTDDTAKMMLEKGTWLDPTVSALYNIAKNKEGLLPEVAAKAVRLEQKSYESFKKAYYAGVPCACGNDAGSSFCYFTDTACEMVIMVEKCGLTPMEALVIGTINSAKMLDVDDILGSVTVGKKAHFAIFRNDPTKDIHALENCLMTIKNGEILHDLSRS